MAFRLSNYLRLQPLQCPTLLQTYQLMPFRCYSSHIKFSSQKKTSSTEHTKNEDTSELLNVEGTEKETSEIGEKMVRRFSYGSRPPSKRNSLFKKENALQDYSKSLRDVIIDLEEDKEFSKLGTYHVIKKAITEENCDWEEIRESLSKTKFPPRKWTALAMKSLSSNNVPNMVAKGMSLLKYSRENGDPSHAEICFFIQLLGRYGFESKYEETILNLFQELSSSTKQFDPSSGSAIIDGLSKTKKWKECLDILEDIKLLKECDYSACTIAEAAFHNDEPELGFDLLKDVEINNASTLNPTNTSEDVYLKILDKKENVLDMLTFMEEYQVVPSEKVASKTADFICRVGTHIQKKTNVFYGRVCGNCGKEMNKPDALTPEQVEELREEYKEHAMMRRNVFISSTPKEVNGFMEFLDRAPRFDIVIDSLNLRSGVHDRRLSIAELVLTAVRCLRKQSLDVLVITRLHAKQLKPAVWSEIEKLASCFTVANKSKDDPFLLYAALHGGPGTFIVTQDELRDHSFLMPSKKLKRNFIRWQRQHQILPLTISKEKMVTEHPPECGVFVQKDHNGYWHIPYEDGKERPSYQQTNSWICIRPVRV